MKKLLLTILLLSLFFALAGSAQAIDTIVDYPVLDPGSSKPGEGLPQFIKYIFIYSLGIVGILGLLVIIIGAFGHLTAVGNPQKAAAAKEKMLSALLGIVLLLGSYILLRTINPDLLKLGIALDPVTVTPTPTEGKYGCIIENAPGSLCSPDGAVLYKDPSCKATKSECKSYCENKAAQYGGAEYKECKKYSSATACTAAQSGCGDTGNKYMCVIEVGNAGLSKTGCTSADQKYLCKSCKATKQACKSYCEGIVQQIDPNGTLDVEYERCEKFSSGTECQGKTGCYNKKDCSN